MTIPLDCADGKHTPLGIVVNECIAFNTVQCHATVSQKVRRGGSRWESKVLTARHLEHFVLYLLVYFGKMFRASAVAYPQQQKVPTKRHNALRPTPMCTFLSDVVSISQET